MGIRSFLAPEWRSIPFSLACAGVLSMALLSACFNGNPNQEPAAMHWDRDRDEQCGMLISDRRFAAQAVEPSGAAHKFDDIGCLIPWLERQPWASAARVWVRDQLADRWLAAEHAQWRTGELTPSGFGFGASQGPDFGPLNFAQVRQQILAGKAAGTVRPGSASAPLPKRAGQL